jgi:hypothetical protein
MLHKSVPSLDNVVKDVLRCLLEMRRKASNHFFIFVSGHKGGEGIKRDEGVLETNELDELGL